MNQTNKFECSSCGKRVVELFDTYPEGIEEPDEICGNCYEDYVYCNICQIHHYTDQTCRHLMYLSEWGWGGCGSNEIGHEAHKESFQSLLGAIGIAGVKDLLRSLEQHNYKHQLSGTIFRYDSMDAYWLDENGKKVNYGDKIFLACFKNPDTYEIGCQWLLSLSCDEPKTIEADDLTTTWVREWLNTEEQKNPIDFEVAEESEEIA